MRAYICVYVYIQKCVGSSRNTNTDSYNRKGPQKFFLKKDGEGGEGEGGGEGGRRRRGREERGERGERERGEGRKEREKVHVIFLKKITSQARCTRSNGKGDSCSTRTRALSVVSLRAARRS